MIYGSKEMTLRVLFFVMLLPTFSLQTATAAEPDQAQKLYLQYCSSCHGKDGRGNGPVSAHLKIKVPDLTLLKTKHKGVYPLDYVMSTIDGRRAVRAHGDRDMPVWGEVFRQELEKGKYKELTTLLTAKVIAEYVATLQR
jgi:mono/diheme cytochrome c family protein